MIEPSQAQASRAGRGVLAEGEPVFAALDLGTNNCRLLVASPERAVGSLVPAIRVHDSFSRIVKLGENVSTSGILQDDAMERTLAALKVCQKKLAKFELLGTRFVATEACRRASNGPAFMQQIFNETGLHIEIIDTEEEARLAFMGCSSLLNEEHEQAIVFDIGGGSTEVMWVHKEAGGERIINDWLSVNFGVMNLADKFGGTNFADMAYGDMVKFMAERIAPFAASNHVSEALAAGNVQFLSTSGTVTTLAAIHFNLPRYDRNRIDGITLDIAQITATTKRLLAMRPSERFNHPCIGPERADYIISGCAIFEAISNLLPQGRVTIADRGVREGIILSLMRQHA